MAASRHQSTHNLRFGQFVKPRGSRPCAPGEFRGRVLRIVGNTQAEIRQTPVGSTDETERSKPKALLVARDRRLSRRRGSPPFRKAGAAQCPTGAPSSSSFPRRATTAVDSVPSGSQTVRAGASEKRHLLFSSSSRFKLPSSTHVRPYTPLLPREPLKIQNCRPSR